ncbi:MAG TPA: IPT/TIG domain-containing protein, partial [Myxococcota bacterium]
ELLGTTVTFNGVPMTNVTTQTQTVITGTTPPGTPGPALVVVSNAMGCQATANYTYDATPMLTSVDPPSALAGTPVTIHGNNFLSGVSLTVGGSATPVTSFTDTTVMFQMPTGHGCDTMVEVTNVGSTSVPILMNGTPTISSFPLSAGPAAGGNLFVVTGQNLLGTTVTFNGVPVTTITSQSNTLIVGQTPPGTPGPAPVVIFNILGCAATTSYTYQ